MSRQEAPCTTHLARSNLFRLNASTVREQTELSYHRARAIANEYGKLYTRETKHKVNTHFHLSINSRRCIESHRQVLESSHGQNMHA